jgi:hypothetical protein
MTQSVFRPEIMVELAPGITLDLDNLRINDYLDLYYPAVRSGGQNRPGFDNEIRTLRILYKVASFQGDMIILIGEILHEGVANVVACSINMISNEVGVRHIEEYRAS